MSRVFILNSAVFPAGSYGTYLYEPATWDELREVLHQKPAPQSRIGYRETAEVIAAQTGVWPAPSRETVTMERGDVAYVVRLRYRLEDPRRKGAPIGAGPEDWEVARIERLE